MSFEKCAAFVLRNVSERAILCQLAEECAELCQAALKMVRIIDGENPTVLTASEAHEKFVEEIADVTLCISVTDCLTDKDFDTIELIQCRKMERWAARVAKQLKA